MSPEAFTLVFMLLSVIGLVLSIIALVKGRKVNNDYTPLVAVLSIVTILLFLGAIVNGILGIALSYYYTHPCSWICMGLGCGAVLFGVAAILVHSKTKNIAPKEQSEKSCR